jgi:hypothetical protein
MAFSTSIIESAAEVLSSNDHPSITAAFILAAVIVALEIIVPLKKPLPA